MERKLVRQGRNALTLTLPAKWLRKYGLNAGELLQVEESGPMLIIRTKEGIKLPPAKIDTSEMTADTIWRNLIGLYIYGFDEVEVAGSQREIVQKILHVLIGWNILEEQKNRVYIKDLTGSVESEFKPMFRRAIRLLLSQIGEGTAVLGGEKPGRLEELGQNLNSYVFYCLRHLNRTGHPDYRQTAVYFHITEQIEGMGDLILRMVMRNRSKPRRGTTHEIRLMEELGKGIEQLEQLIFSFEKEKLLAFSSYLSGIRKKLCYTPFEVQALEFVEAMSETMESLFTLEQCV